MISEKSEELIRELENCAVSIGGGSGESFSRAVEIAPLLLRKAVDEIKNILLENAMLTTEYETLGARIGFYKRQSEWLTGEVDHVISEYEKKLQDLREICE